MNPARKRYSSERDALKCHCREVIHDVEMGLRTCGHHDDEMIVCPHCNGEGGLDDNGNPAPADAAVSECALCNGYGQTYPCEVEA